MTEPAEVDAQVREAIERGDPAQAASVTIHRYGAEIMGLLVALARDESIAADAYSLFCERLWQGLGNFRFEASVRTFAYVIARRTLVDVRRARARGPQLVDVAPSQLPPAVEDARSSTRPHLKTTNKNQLRALRETLSDDDQMLLVLRLDRQLAWDEIARVLAEDPAHAEDPAERRRLSAALRKRFQRAKDKLAAELGAGQKKTD